MILNNCKTICIIVSLVIQTSWFLILRIPFLEKTLENFGPIRRPKTLSFRDSEDSPNSQYFSVMHTAWHWVVDIVFSDIKETNEQNSSYVNPCRLINKINRLHKSIYKELLEKDWSFLFSTPNELTIPYHGIIEIIWNKFSDFSKSFFS